MAPCACVGTRRSGRRRRWPDVTTVGRALFIISVAFFVVGVLVTVFGFRGTDDLTNAETRSGQLPLQVCTSCLQLHRLIAQRMTVTLLLYNLKLNSLIFYARKQLLLSPRLSHHNSVRLSLCPYVCPSHGWMSQKRCKLGS